MRAGCEAGLGVARAIYGPGLARTIMRASPLSRQGRPADRQAPRWCLHSTAATCPSVPSRRLAGPLGIRAAVGSLPDGADFRTPVRIAPAKPRASVAWRTSFDFTLTKRRATPYTAAVVNNRKEVVQCLIVSARVRRVAWPGPSFPTGSSPASTDVDPATAGRRAPGRGTTMRGLSLTGGSPFSVFAWPTRSLSSSTPTPAR